MTPLQANRSVHFAALQDKLAAASVQPPASSNVTESFDAEGRLIIVHQEGDPQIEVDPLKIDHAFIVLTVTDFPKHATKAQKYIVESNRACNPELWSREFKFTMGVIASSPAEDGFPTLTGLGKGLAKCGVTPNHSVAMYTRLGNFDGGSTHQNIRVGFAFRDTNPRFLILWHPNSCIPKMPNK